MAFTYLDTLATDRDKVRFHIQDTIEDEGRKPNNGNFSDAEIDGLLTIEGSWQRAVAAGFEALASIWATESSFSVFNGQFTRNTVGVQYQKLAELWRDKYGEGGSATEELDAKTTDFSGDTVVPLFQREAFGHKVTDWDPA
jgi:hypothetical protein